MNDFIDDCVKRFVSTRDFVSLIDFMNETFDIDAILSRGESGIYIVDGKTGKDFLFIHY